MNPTPERSSEKVTLGQYLAAIRNARGLTLRQVEEGTNKLISNAYLSQIENDKIQKPSPNLLHALATLYAIDYENLMELAGYIAASRGSTERHGRVATFSEINLTPDEEAQLLRFLSFIRTEKGST
ncbi:helix-turn-helix domain-containing protein [Bradyrhizobium sp. 5.13L]